MNYGIRCAECDEYQSNGRALCVFCGLRLRAKPLLNRRHFFAAAGALVVTPVLPPIETEPTLLEILCSVPSHCQFANVRGIVYERVRYWMREGAIYDSWRAPLDFGSIEIRGTVSV